MFVITSFGFAICRTCRRRRTCAAGTQHGLTRRDLRCELSGRGPRYHQNRTPAQRPACASPGRRRGQHRARVDRLPRRLRASPASARAEVPGVAYRLVCRPRRNSVGRGRPGATTRSCGGSRKTWRARQLRHAPGLRLSLRKVLRVESSRPFQTTLPWAQQR